MAASIMDVSKMCRFCMRTDRRLCQIFVEPDEQSDLDGHNNLAELLMQHSPLTLQRNDKLPQQICEDCKSTALIASRFHNECMSTQQRLITLLGGGGGGGGNGNGGNGGVGVGDGGCGSGNDVNGGGGNGNENDINGGGGNGIGINGGGFNENGTNGGGSNENGINGGSDNGNGTNGGNGNGCGGENFANSAVDCTNTADTVNKKDADQFNRIVRAAQIDCETPVGYGQHVTATTTTTSQCGGGNQVETIIKCPVCNRQFIHDESFRQHLQVEHQLISHKNSNSEFELMVIEEEELPILESTSIVPDNFEINSSDIEQNILEFDPDIFEELLEVDEENEREIPGFKEEEQPLSSMMRHDSLSSLILEVCDIDEGADKVIGVNMIPQMIFPETSSSTVQPTILDMADLSLFENDMGIEQTNVSEKGETDSNGIDANLYYMDMVDPSISILLGKDEPSSSHEIEYVDIETIQQPNKADDNLPQTELINSIKEQKSDEQVKIEDKEIPKRGRPCKKVKNAKRASKRAAKPAAKRVAKPAAKRAAKPGARATKAKEKGLKIHKCNICSKTFTTNLYLTRHIANHEKKSFACKECPQIYYTRKDLNLHISEQGHDKPLLCTECGFRCKIKNVMTMHMIRHQGFKPYKCKFCNKGFARIDDARVHEKYHTDEKTHFCPWCNKGFLRKYNLTIHMRVHTGERPFKCFKCPLSFAQNNDLKAHIRRHIGERYTCDQCDASFMQYYQIRQHKLSEHGILQKSPTTQRVAKFTSIETQEEQIELTRSLNNTVTALPATEATTVAGSLVTITNTSAQELSTTYIIQGNSIFLNNINLVLN